MPSVALSGKRERTRLPEQFLKSIWRKPWFITWKSTFFFKFVRVCQARNVLWVFAPSEPPSSVCRCRLGQQSLHATWKVWQAQPTVATLECASTTHNANKQKRIWSWLFSPSQGRGQGTSWLLRVASGAGLVTRGPLGAQHRHRSPSQKVSKVSISLERKQEVKKEISRQGSSGEESKEAIKTCEMERMQSQLKLFKDKISGQMETIYKLQDGALHTFWPFKNLSRQNVSVTGCFAGRRGVVIL